MQTGRYFVQRIEDVVAMAQVGWFPGPLMEAFVEADLEATAEAARVGGGKCRKIVDCRELFGTNVPGHLALERALSRMAPLIEQTVVITPSFSLRAVMRAGALFVPELRYVFAEDVDDALSLLARPAMEPQLRALLAAPPWQSLVREPQR